MLDTEFQEESHKKDSEKNKNNCVSSMGGTGTQTSLSFFFYFYKSKHNEKAYCSLRPHSTRTTTPKLCGSIK